MDQDLPTGFRQTPLGLLPQGWEAVSLGSLILRSFSGGTPSTKRPDYWNGSIPWITSAYIDGLYVLQGVKGITQAGLDHSASKLVSRDNLLVGTRVGVGKVAINKIDIAISQDLTGLVIDKEQAHLEFLAYALSSSAAQRAFVSATRGTTIKGIPRDDLLKILVPLPPLPEQRAIAGVLRTVQRAIAAAEQVIAAACELKRSLMRHLFTYGPVTVAEAGQVALRETEIGPVPEQWEAVSLGDVLSTTQYGLSVRGAPTGQYPILRMNCLVDGAVEASNLQFVDLGEAEFRKFRLNKGDLLFNRTNSIDLVGKTGLFGLDGDFVFASYLIRAVTDERRCLPAYLNYYLNWEPTQARLRAIATRGVSQSNISASKLRGFVVALPPRSDQQEIAATLAAVDHKIAAELTRGAALAALFEGLLQSLMTGRVRVN